MSESTTTPCDYLPFGLNISLIIFLSYSFFVYYIVPKVAVFSGALHLAFLILIVWTLVKLSLSDPGYVKTTYKFVQQQQSEQQTADSENQIINNSKKYLLIQL